MDASLDVDLLAFEAGDGHDLSDDLLTQVLYDINLVEDARRV